MKPTMTFSILLFLGLALCNAQENKNPDQIIKLLQDGNARFVSGAVVHPQQGEARRMEVFENGQAPFATVLSCSDSRGPVELIFDQGIGDVFVVRVAGNICGLSETASLEYAAEHLKIPLLIVLGHSKCGAVTAVVKEEKVHGSLPQLAAHIVPAVEKAKQVQGKDFSDGLLHTSIEENVWHSIAEMLQSEIISELVQEGKIKVVGAFYDLHSGEVKWLGSHPAEKELLKSKHH